MTAPALDCDAAAALFRRLYCPGDVAPSTLRCSCTALPSYIDKNFAVHLSVDTTAVEDEAAVKEWLHGALGLPPHFALRSGPSFVLKVSHAEEAAAALAMQHCSMHCLEATRLCPAVADVAAASDRCAEDRGIAHCDVGGGTPHYVRLVTFLDGRPLAQVPEDERSPELHAGLGAAMATIDAALAAAPVPAGADYDLRWDVRRAEWVLGRTDVIADHGDRGAVLAAMVQFQAHALRRLAELPTQVLHNDANDHNVLVTQDSSGGPWRVAGVVDFGDMVRTCRVCEVAIAVAYAVLDKPDPVAVAAAVCRGYHAVLPLLEAEVDAVWALVLGRYCISVVCSAEAKARDPGNAYITVSERPVWAMLHRAAALPMADVQAALRRACGMAADGLAVAPVRSGGAPVPELPVEELRARRAAALGPSLSVMFASTPAGPLKAVRGRGQFLFASDAAAALDCVNNVAHVGHCHPAVVAAEQRQAAELNTNARFLHDAVVVYAERLAATMPRREGAADEDQLSVVFFVNSGSEANELALRMARAVTKRRGVVVLDHAYHGHTAALVDMSPYKAEGPGGDGLAEWAFKAAMPDTTRGPFSGEPEAAAAAGYAAEVEACVARAAATRYGFGAFFAEGVLGCGGQVVPPKGFLAASYAAVRKAGGVCVADEVQTGFGRTGAHFWAFEANGGDAVPDIVTMGKPMGNGHPVAGVVCTPRIARAFANGMEYFNTFGGNPVSCAVGLAVLDAIEEGDLAGNAARVGDLWASLFKAIAATPHGSVIRDIRGLGLFLGVDFADTAALGPGGAVAAHVTAALRGLGVLVGVDGPGNTVLKLKPPLCFTEGNARLVADAVDWALRGLVDKGAAPR